MLCFLGATFVGRSESESWEVFASAGTSVSSRLSANSSNHSREIPQAVSRCLLVVLFFLVGFWFWDYRVGFHAFVGKHRHFVNLLD